MPTENILVIAVDGLRASALGAYGNTWYETPHLDRLAAESILAEWCFANAVTLPEVYRALWFGEHPLRAPTGAPSLPQRIAELGYQTRLLTDEAQLPELAGAVDFDAIDLVAGGADAVAEDIAETRAALLMASVAEAFQQGQRPQFIWVHVQGMYGSWDAPLALRATLAEDDDPAVYSESRCPDTHIDAVVDPDARFRYACAYAAQVQVFDAALGLLWHELGRDDAPWHVVLVGTRGFPLGEHGRVGGFDERLSGEQLHVPLLVCSSDRRGALERTGALVEHADVAATVLAWAAGDQLPRSDAFADGLAFQSLLSPETSWRDRSVAAHDAGTRSVRTDNWCWRGTIEQAANAEGQERGAVWESLFVRPDDRWEGNDVITLRSEVAAALRAVATDFAQWCQQPARAELSPLDELLLEPVK